MTTFRTVQPADAPAIAAIYAPYVEKTVVSFEMIPPDAAEIGRRIAATIVTHPWLVAEQDGAVIGYAYAGRFNARAAYDWSAETTIYFDAGHHRRGVGRLLYGALFAILRRQGFHRLFALITVPNDASLALHRAFGMREIGVYREVGFKFGAWRDVMSMGVALDEIAAPAKPPTAFPDLALAQDDFR